MAEMAIPFKSLRYQPGREQTWGIQLRRRIRSKNETAYLTAVSRRRGGPARSTTCRSAATLVGIEVPPAALNLEIKPYAVSRVDDRSAEPTGASERRRARMPAST